MSKLTITRTTSELPDAGALEAVQKFLFGMLDGVTRDDKRAWRSFWQRVTKASPGEVLNVELLFPRVGEFHRRHMQLEQRVFDAQQRFADFALFRDWLKIGSGWVVWVPGAKGGVVPLPKSTSFSRASEEAFRDYHAKVVSFLLTPHAQKYLWPKVAEAERATKMQTIVEECA